MCLKRVSLELHVPNATNIVNFKMFHGYYTLRKVHFQQLHRSSDQILRKDRTWHHYCYQGCYLQNLENGIPAHFLDNVWQFFLEYDDILTLKKLSLPNTDKKNQLFKASNRF